MSDKLKKPLTERQKRAMASLRKLSKLFDFPPCEFCGRIVLIGVCCQKRLDKAKAERLKTAKENGDHSCDCEGPDAPHCHRCGSCDGTPASAMRGKHVRMA